MIDHTELKPIATEDRIRELCHEAVENEFGTVCVNSCCVEIALEELKDSDVEVCSVVGFPLGAMLTDAKAFETKSAVEKGATEIDMVMNLGMLKSGNLKGVEKDIAAVVKAAKSNTVKVILETGYLTEDEIVTACKTVKKAGAHFVKTSTGFGPRGASIEDVRIMQDTVGDALGIKAAGGIGTYEDAISMIDAGATRIGASRGIDIIKGAKK
ncbi:deoxyribose-phosphate aldolase [Candidatus Thorarchaeota archaeon]|nr:MAG: deoxyribose-phosphate aldolase [Candidatus Thorarchaeota archaeon]